jgi:hypothetical protein
MRKLGTVLVLLLLFACTGKQDPFIGRWTVEKVNVDFNENIATPEMVRQYGEMERGNVIEISKDSVLTFISDGDTVRGKCFLKGSQLFCDGQLFGSLADGTLTTENATPLGKVTVFYVH